MESAEYSHRNVSQSPLFICSVQNWIPNLLHVAGVAKTKRFAFGHRRATRNGKQKQFYRTAIRERFAASHGHGTVNSWRRPVSTQQQPSGTKNQANSNATQRLKGTKMKWKVCRGRSRAICWQHAVATNRCGYGKWLAKMNSNVRPCLMRINRMSRKSNGIRTPIFWLRPATTTQLNCTPKIQPTTIGHAWTHWMDTNRQCGVFRLMQPANDWHPAVTIERWKFGKPMSRATKKGSPRQTIRQYGNVFVQYPAIIRAVFTTFHGANWLVSESYCIFFDEWIGTDWSFFLN